MSLVPAPDRYAVLGNPVAHSRSPFIHTAFAQQTGQRLSYGRVLCAPDGFEAALRQFRREGGRGCNVTVPFKFEALRLAARATPRAALAGAANTLRWDEDGWYADNTDGVGLLRDIEQSAVWPVGAGAAEGVEAKRAKTEYRRGGPTSPGLAPWAQEVMPGGAGFSRVAADDLLPPTFPGGRRVLLIGAGGAAAGVLGPLLYACPSCVRVVNRSADKAIALVARHADLARVQGVDLAAAALATPGEGFDLVINASASSLHGAPVPVPVSVLGAGALAIDLMYGPAAEPFLAWARAAGARPRDGLGMLVEQAAEAFAFWRGVHPLTAPVLQALRAQANV